MSRNEGLKAEKRVNPAPKTPERAAATRKPDARIRRTHERLGSAMVALMQEKPIEQVTVQDVLERAQVGRSTFYLHFRDKDDLLMSQLEMFCQVMSTSLSLRKEKSMRVVPVEEMFSHIGEQKRMYRALGDSGHLTDFFELAQGYFARGIEHRLKELGRVGRVPPRELRARCSALAGSLLSLFRWWMERGAKEPAKEMDELFHKMVWKGLE